MEYIERIDALGGVLACIQNGFFQREIAESAYRYQQEIDAHWRTIVGVNDYVMDEDIKVPTLYIDRVGERAHLDRLNRVRRERDQRRCQTRPGQPAPRRRWHRKHHARYHRGGESLRDAGRDHGCLPRRLRRVYGTGGVLAAL